ncbi:carbohydrate porin [Caulobacter sp. S45]|uniref:carbohydrate porin n=1 Tax=Caulobacter sp. S45 TaxID=1641861 RepID=UPI00157584F6|nr:carbohydrate porin [Caulobacter sp. S45]
MGLLRRSLALIPATVLAASTPLASLAQAPSPPADMPKEPAKSDSIWALNTQATVVDQSDSGVPGDFRGANSLSPASQSRETVDLTLYGGLNPWKGAEIWISPEIDQGFGLSDTLGTAGFLSGEAYKVGQATPYIRLQRLFFRQTLDLGGAAEKTDADLFTFAGDHTHDRLVFTAGKIGVGDVFDTNAYAHDPRGDFLNWSIIDTGTFDYAADAWGYSYGSTLEWYVGDWTLRGGGFSMSKVPNGENLESNFSQYELVGELERRYRLAGREGKLRLTAFENRARYGDFADALREGAATDSTPDLTVVRRYRGHAGASLDWEQPVGEDAGVFLRAGYADGHQQAYEFTDIDRTAAFGLSLQGKRWGRPDDTVGVAGVVNDIARDFRTYLAAGGLGILIGDGQLPHYQTERILETYYSLKATGFAHVSLDYQYVQNPAYDRVRGPVSVIGVRLHIQGMAP